MLSSPIGGTFAIADRSALQSDYRYIHIVEYSTYTFVVQFINGSFPRKDESYPWIKVVKGDSTTTLLSIREHARNFVLVA